MDPYVCVHGVGPDGICEACCERDTCPHDELVCGECYRVFDAKLKAAEARAEKAEAEVRYLRAWQEWAERRGDLECGRMQYPEDPEPQPPEGALHINYEPGCWECDDANPSTEAEPERICGRTEASCQQDRQDMAEAIAERDALTSELAEARRQLAEVTRERDALKAGKWAGAWEEVGHEWHRANGRGVVAEASQLRPTAHRHDVRWFWEVRAGADDTCATANEAKAAADAHLEAAGWWLEGGAFEADAPQHPAPGGEDPSKMGTP